MDCILQNWEPKCLTYFAVEMKIWLAQYKSLNRNSQPIKEGSFSNSHQPSDIDLHLHQIAPGMWPVAEMTKNVTWGVWTTGEEFQ